PIRTQLCPTSVGTSLLSSTSSSLSCSRVVFCGFRGLPDLHSFPTRRSSDLTSPAGERQLRENRAAWVRADARRAGPDPGRSILRSEEHTSELQSHLNIVCRLLLEKKKKTTTTRGQSSQTKRSTAA